MRFFLLLLLPLAVFAEDVFHPEPTGTFTYAGVRFGLLIQGPGILASSAAMKPEDGWPKQEGAAWETRGSITLSSGAVVRVVERVVKLADGAADVELRLESATPMKVDTAAMVVELPVADFVGRGLVYNGGEAVPLPREASEGMLSAHWKSGIATITIPSGEHSLTLHGTLDCAVADERVWDLPRFGLRLFCQRADAPALTKATLRFSVGPAAP